MLVLLAPSEGKAPPTDGPPLALGRLVHADELTVARERVLKALETVAARRPRTALAALGLSPGQASELERDRTLRSAPTRPAAEVYTGVLYQHLDLVSLDPDSRARAGERLLVASALFGVLRLSDPIPAYRLSMSATLSPLRRSLPALWRPALTRALPPDGLVVDLRSGSYASAWRPAGGVLVEVRAFAEQRDGARLPVSHMAKAVRGDVARLIAQATDAPADVEQVAQLVAAGGHRVALEPPAGSGAAWRLNVVQPARGR